VTLLTHVDFVKGASKQCINGKLMLPVSQPWPAAFVTLSASNAMSASSDGWSVLLWRGCLLPAVLLRLACYEAANTMMLRL
jgi:hypothetical protein